LLKTGEVVGLIILCVVVSASVYIYMDYRENQRIIQYLEDKAKGEPSESLDLFYSEVMYYQPQGIKVYEADFDEWYYDTCPGSAVYGVSVSREELRTKIMMTKAYFAEEDLSWEVEVFSNLEHTMLWALCYNSTNLSRIELCVCGDYSNLTQCVFTVNTESPYLTEDEERELRSLIFEYKNEDSTRYNRLRNNDWTMEEYNAEMQILDAYVEAVLSGERHPYRFEDVKTIINYTLTREEAETYNIQDGSNPYIFYQQHIFHGNNRLGSGSEGTISEKFKKSANYVSVEHIDKTSFSCRYRDIEIELWVRHLDIPMDVGVLTATIIAYDPETNEQMIIAANSTVDPRNGRVIAKGMVP